MEVSSWDGHFFLGDLDQLGQDLSFFVEERVEPALSDPLSDVFLKPEVPQPFDAD